MSDKKNLDADKNSQRQNEGKGQGKSGNREPVEAGATRSASQNPTTQKQNPDNKGDRDFHQMTSEELGQPAKGQPQTSQRQGAAAAQTNKPRDSNRQDDQSHAVRQNQQGAPVQKPAAGKGQSEARPSH